MKNGRWKLLGLIFVTLSFFIAVFIFLINGITSSINMDYINREYKSLEASLKLQQSMIYDRLVESSYLLAENSTFKANLQLEDDNSLDYSAKDFALFMKVDLFVILDRDNKVKFDLHQHLKSNNYVTDYSPIIKNLQGRDPETTFTSANLLSFNNTIYQVVAVPVFAGKDRILGTIIMGANFEDFVLKPLKDASPFDLYVYYNNKARTSQGAPFESSIAGFSQVSQNDTLNNLKYNITTKGFGYLRSNGKKNIVFATPLGALNKGLLLAAIPEKKACGDIDFWHNYYFLVALSACIIFTFATAFAGWKMNKRQTF